MPPPPLAGSDPVTYARGAACGRGWSRRAGGRRFSAARGLRRMLIGVTCVSHLARSTIYHNVPLCIIMEPTAVTRRATERPDNVNETGELRGRAGRGRARHGRYGDLGFVPHKLISKLHKGAAWHPV